MKKAEYIWIDGQRPTAKVRSKTRIIEDDVMDLDKLPIWGFDGSSTFQADAEKSDRVLRPVAKYPDPIRGNQHLLVLCEVDIFGGGPHPSNTRAYLRDLAEKHEELAPWFGIEQEYTMFDRNGLRPLRWPEGGGYPAPQGQYYCGVGSDEVFGRDLAEEHMDTCLAAGIKLYGVNAEVMASQWEFQLGPGSPLEIADQLWVARWLLYRLGENSDHKITVKLDAKPVSAKEGSWNGAGAHINFSTRETRADGGIKEIDFACGRLEQYHDEHIQPHVYGDGNHDRLTGQHETCDIKTFKSGVGHRGASVRIPAQVAQAKKGYLEDRRPAANIDPYRAFSAILDSVLGEGFDSEVFAYFKGDN